MPCWDSRMDVGMTQLHLALMSWRFVISSCLLIHSCICWEHQMVAAGIRLVRFSFGLKLTCESFVREAGGYLTRDGPSVLLQASSRWCSFMHGFWIKQSKADSRRMAKAPSERIFYLLLYGKPCDECSISRLVVRGCALQPLFFCRGWTSLCKGEDE